jgi:hypothetical protein
MEIVPPLKNSKLIILMPPGGFQVLLPPRREKDHSAAGLPRMLKSASLDAIHSFLPTSSHPSTYAKLHLLMEQQGLFGLVKKN